MPPLRLMLHCEEFNSAVILLAFRSYRKGNMAVSVPDCEPGKMAWVHLLRVLPLVRVLPISKLLQLELAAVGQLVVYVFEKFKDRI